MGLNLPVHSLLKTDFIILEKLLENKTFLLRTAASRRRTLKATFHGFAVKSSEFNAYFGYLVGFSVFDICSLVSFLRSGRAHFFGSNFRRRTMVLCNTPCFIFIPVAYGRLLLRDICPNITVRNSSKEQCCFCVISLLRSKKFEKVSEMMLKYAQY